MVAKKFQKKKIFKIDRPPKTNKKETKAHISFFTKKIARGEKLEKKPEKLLEIIAVFKRTYEKKGAKKN